MIISGYPEVDRAFRPIGQGAGDSPMHADRQAAMLLAGILALAGCAGANRPSLGGSDLVVPDHLPGQPDAPDDADDLATDPGSQDPTPGDAAAVDTDAAPQDLPPEIDLATPPQLVLSDTSLDFGTAACAADAAAKRTLTLHNAGGSPLTWAAALSADDAFALPAETGGTLAAGGTATLDVTLKGVPANATAATPWTATLTVTSNDPTAPSVAIPLKVTPLGATLALAPPTAAFGQVPLDGPGAQLSLTLTNTGNLPVDVTPGQPPDDAFALTWTAAPAAVTYICIAA